ncbi:methyltransferase domain-containing protein [Sphingomonas floccifaciens]|uniref:Methyltransferase domain-containing protein n=1 Tax=Sphingomonas floccifaciens TaxID=1844115 RepID=A0ABW4NGT9_9SPHN
MSTSEIFDRAARRLRRDRAAADWRDYAFLRDMMLDGIADRLATVKRDFRDVLDLGSADGAFALPGAAITRVDAGARFATGAVQADEDRIDVPAASFDLVVSAGVLDTVNDVPGALALARRALRPDGVFFGTFLGGGSLSTLRAALRDADPGTARAHPMIDVRSAGDLLVRAGFALPVADVESVTVRYGNLFGLVRDLRGMAASNLLTDRRPLRRDTLARLAEAFTARADADGRVAERFDIVYLTGWAPDPSQPKPARRGSATASLTAALQKGLEQPD